MAVWKFRSVYIHIIHYVLTHEYPHTIMSLFPFAFITDFLVTVNVAPHECVIRTGQP